MSAHSPIVPPRALRFGTLVMALAAVLAACAPAAPTAAPAPAAPEQPQLAERQTLTVGTSALPPTTDPQLSVSGTVRRFDIFETLVAPDPSFQNIQPLLAERWETVNPTTWRFTLRPNSRFHDGTPVTAADAEFSWQRARRPEFRSPIPGNLSGVESITAVDARTVQITTRNPDPLLLRRLLFFAVLPKAYIERVGDQEFARTPIGSGPYRLREFRPDDRYVLQAWPEHPYRRPVLTEITVRNVPDGSARLNGLRTGELDLAHLVTVDSAPTLQRDGFTLAINNLGVLIILLDCYGADGNCAGPLADRRVRQAINYAIDRDALAQTVYRGLGRPAGVLVAEGVNGYSPQVRPYTLDRARARQLLTEAGYPNGFRLQFEFSVLAAETQPAALFVQDQMRQIGIELELAPVETAAFVDKIYKRRPIAPMFMTATTPGTLLDADSSLSFFVSDSIFGKRFVNARFDAAYNRMREELDPQRRLQLVREALDILQEEVPYAGVVTQPTISAHNRTVRIEGGLPPDLWPLFDRVTRIR